VTDRPKNIIDEKEKKARWGIVHHGWGGLVLAEFASMATSLGVVAVADTIAPNLINKASDVVAKVVIEPHLDTIEKFMGKVCKLEECKPDQTKSREERAHNLAHTSIIFGAAWIGSMLVKLATRSIYRRFGEVVAVDNKPHFGFTKHDWKLAFWDESVHIGSFLLWNSGMPKQADAAVVTGTKMLQKTLGLSEDKAKNVATMAVVWEFPNIMGLLSAGRVVYSDGMNGKLMHARNNATLNPSHVVAAALDTPGHGLT